MQTKLVLVVALCLPAAVQGQINTQTPQQVAESWEQEQSASSGEAAEISGDALEQFNEAVDSGQVSSIPGYGSPASVDHGRGGPNGGFDDQDSVLIRAELDQYILGFVVTWCPTLSAEDAQCLADDHIVAVMIEEMTHLSENAPDPALAGDPNKQKACWEAEAQNIKLAYLCAELDSYPVIGPKRDCANLLKAVIETIFHKHFLVWSAP